MTTDSLPNGSKSVTSARDGQTNNSPGQADTDCLSNSSQSVSPAVVEAAVSAYRAHKEQTQPTWLEGKGKQWTRALKAEAVDWYLAHTCQVDGCDRPTRCKNLCAMHYARKRRTGDPATVRRPGRPPDKRRAMLRGVMGPEMSERTFARFNRAMQLLTDLDLDATSAIAEATRPGGSLNVSKLERIADQRVMRAVMEGRI